MAEQEEILCWSVQGVTAEHCWELVGPYLCRLRTMDVYCVQGDMVQDAIHPSAGLG